MKKAKIVGLLLSLVCLVVVARDVDDPNERQPQKKGNFALPVSQQAAPLIGFGQNIMDPGDAQFFMYMDRLSGWNIAYATLYPTLLYATSDKSSLLIQLPIYAKNVYNNTHSAGLSDLTVQGEYAFYEYNTDTTTTMCTAVANLSIPTGALYKQPATGYGSPTFFVGGTANHVSDVWYVFAALGGLFTTEKFGTKYANQFYYQGGLSRNINYRTDHWIFNWMVEVNGIYAGPSELNGVLSPSSGGTILGITPSLWFSTRRFFAQGGITWLAWQHLFGHQLKATIYAAFEFGITF